MKGLATALLGAMGEISYLQKDKAVGTGRNSYKALSDESATKGIRNALMKHNIVVLQSSIDEQTEAERWQEESNYNGTVSYKAKIHVFTRVKTTFTIIHAPSGESMQVQAIGHGIDSGDKAAGKAMTYAKKNALLNCLLISTGLDADNTHSDDLPQPPAQKHFTQIDNSPAKPWFNPTNKDGSESEQGTQWIAYALKVGVEKAIQATEGKYKVSDASKEWMQNQNL